MDDLVSELAAKVLDSRKYAHIAPELAARLVREELGKGRKPKDVVKAVRNKLHQVGGAYQVQVPQYEDWLRWLQEAGTPDELKSVCRGVMGMHASTKERLLILDQIYTGIFGLLPPVHSVLDAACGLNPLALPWMPLAADAHYYACDIYADMVAFLNRFFSLMPQTGSAQVCDLAVLPADQQVDLALVMKAIPCLEQIDKRAGERLLDGLQCRFLAVSFPAKSLGGRRKGMVENYSSRFEQITAGRGWNLLERLEFATELVFIVDCEGNSSLEKDFATLISVLEKVHNLLLGSSDAVFSNYEVDETAIELQICIEEIKKQNYANIPHLFFLLAPTGPVCEIAIDNGWGNEYVDLANSVEAYIRRLNLNR